jgi:hypothetical protein
MGSGGARYLQRGFLRLPDAAKELLTVTTSLFGEDPAVAIAKTQTILLGHFESLGAACALAFLAGEPDFFLGDVGENRRRRRQSGIGSGKHGGSLAAMAKPRCESRST